MPGGRHQYGIAGRRRLDPDRLADLTLAGGTISGLGTLTANTDITGFGTVSIPLSSAGALTASGGTLDLAGTVSNRTLAISSASPSDLKISGTATSAAAITLNNANQTLEIGAAGSLTINAAQTATNGTMGIDGGALTDTSGITLTSPATLTGSGTIAANTALSGAGTVTASGGTLDLLGTVNSGLVLAIATGSPSILKIDGTATSAAAITLNNANQTLEIGARRQPHHQRAPARSRRAAPAPWTSSVRSPAAWC